MRPIYLQIPIIICLFMMGCQSEEKGQLSGDVSSIGDAVQISLSCANVEKSLAFYKKLHFSILEPTRPSPKSNS